MERNKIYLGDAYELIKQIPDKSIDLIYTDIPYDFEGNGGGGCFGEKKRNYHAEYEKVALDTTKTSLSVRKAKHNMAMEGIAFGIDFSILDEFVRVLKKIYVYIWCSKKQILPLMEYFVKKHNCYFDLLVWHKTNPIPTANNKYLSDLEYCLVFREQGTKIGGTYETKSKCYHSQINKADKEQFVHPTCKPLEFVKRHISNSIDIERERERERWCWIHLLVVGQLVKQRKNWEWIILDLKLIQSITR